MLQTRQNVFETNSSSTHSITMCMKKDYDAWNDNEVYFIDSYRAAQLGKQFVTWDEVVTWIKEQYPSSSCETIDELMKLKEEGDGAMDELLSEYNIYTVDSFYNQYNEYGYESFENTFTTPTGEEVVAFGYYGENR